MKYSIKYKISNPINLFLVLVSFSEIKNYLIKFINDLFLKKEMKFLNDFFSEILDQYIFKSILFSSLTRQLRGFSN